MRWLTLVLVGLCGCAIPSRYVTRGELADIAARPAPPVKEDRAPIDVASWTLTGPFPPGYQPIAHSNATPWAQKLIASGSVTSGNLECLARELAKFVAANHGQPALELQQFMASRCGVTARYITGSMSGDAPSRMDDDALWAAYGKSVKGVFSQLHQNAIAGIALERVGEKGSMVLVQAVPGPKITAVPFAPGPDGTVVIEGSLGESAETVSALINLGETGVARCESDPDKKLPQFKVTCTPLATDAVADISISAVAPGRLLGHQVIGLQVFPSGEPPMTWTRSTRVLEGDFLAALNAVRASAKLQPLRLADKQTALAQQLAAQFRGDDAPLEDRIALGMMAGWDVDGAVNHGDFFADTASGQDELSLLRDMLASPGGRFTLLAPEAQAIAFGTDTVGRLISGIAATYTMLPDLSGEAVARQVLEKLDAARAAKGKTPAHWLTLPEFQAGMVKHVRAGKWSPTDALNHFMQAAQEAQHVGVRGWDVSTSQLSELKFPDDLINAEALNLYVEVVQYRTRGDPWHLHHVLFVYGEPATSNVASRPSFPAPDEPLHAG